MNSMPVRLRSVSSLLTAAALLTGCAVVPARDCASGEQPMLSETLYFGTQTPRGAVTPGQWEDFLAGSVTPRFPQGLTVWPVTGQWRSADGTLVREDSHALTLVHADDATSEASLRAIVAEYRTRFAQEAVLRVKSRACVAF